MNKSTRRMRLKLFIALFAVTCISGCATTTRKCNNPQDPWENFNRGTYAFNQKFDIYFLKPVATAYNKILPAFVRKGVHNIFANAAGVPTIINDVLQANVYYLCSDTWRLFFNTTLGIGGFFDVAIHMGLEPHVEDLGITFAKWGYKNSAYFVIPFVGPSTFRDTVAWLINYQFFTVYPWIQPLSIQYAILGLDFLDTRAHLLEFEDTRKAASLDPYLFDRSAYLQYRQIQIKGCKNNDDNDDSYIENEMSEITKDKSSTTAKTAENNNSSIENEMDEIAKEKS